MAGTISLITSQLLATATGSTSKKTGSQLAKELSGQATKVTISGSAQVGAARFAGAFQNLNSLIRTNNITEAALKKIGKIVDKVELLAEKLTQNSSNVRGVVRQLESLGKEFNKVIKQSKIGNEELLSKDGLSNIFSLIGLKPDESEAVKKVFDKFKTLADGDSLADAENAKAKKYKIPPSAYGTSSTTVETTTYDGTLTQVTDTSFGSTTQQFVDGAVYGGVDTITGNNPSVGSVVVTNDVPITTTLAPGISANYSIVSVNQSNGYSYATTTDDPLGYNTGGNTVIIGIDALGHIVHQYNVGAAGDAITSLDVSDDGLSLVYSYVDGSANKGVKLIQVGTIGEDPSTSTVTALAAGGPTSLYGSAKISDDGSYAAYLDINGGTINLLDTATQTVDTTLQGLGSAYEIGFSDDNELTMVVNGASNQDVVKFAYGDGAFTNILTNVNAVVNYQGFSVLQGASGGYFAYKDSSNNDVLLYNEAGSLQTSYDLGGGDTLYNLSTAYNENGDVEVGMYATITSLQSGAELYRLEKSGASYTINQITDSTTNGDYLASGFISTVSDVWGSDNDVLEYNPTYNSVVIQTRAATTGAIAPGMTYGVSLLGTNEVTGYSVVSSQEDFLGYNASNYTQLYVVDISGKVVSQITNETSGIAFQSATLAADNKTVLYVADAGSGKYMTLGQTGAFGEDPSGTTRTTVESAAIATEYYGLRISNDGSHIAYTKQGMTGTKTLQLKDTATLTTDAFLETSTTTSGGSGFFETNQGTYDFIDSDKLALAQISSIGAPSPLTVKTYTDGAGSYGATLASIDIDNSVYSFSAFEKGSNGNGYFALNYRATGATDRTNAGYSDATSDNLVGKDLVASGDNVETVNALYHGGELHVGIRGILPSVNSDSDHELYDLTFDTSTSSETVAGSGLSRRLGTFEGILDPTRIQSKTLGRKPEAYAFLADVRELKKQIKDNLAALEDTRKLISDHMDVVRSISLTLLDISQGKTINVNTVDAEVQAIRARIPKNALASIDSHSLDGVTVAALVNSTSK